MPQDSSWERVSALFDQALDVRDADLGPWLEANCPDPELRRELDSLLDAHRRAAGVLEKAPDRPQTAATGPVQADRTITSGSIEAKGRRVGPYELVREIGRGGMGVVYLGRDPRLERRVALKFLPSRLRAGDQAEERFLNEARAASALDHPNICTIYDIGETDDDRLYLAMAFYEGLTAAERLAQGPPSIDEVRDLALQTARGLQCAHEAGIVHRDIKPSNLLITKKGEVKIVDFGIAKLEGRRPIDPGLRIGTLSYMSPEQADGSEVGSRSDLWSLGVTLFELLTGVRPFRADYDSALLYEICNEPHPRLSELRTDAPAWLERVVDRLLEKDPLKRLGSAAELITELEASGPAPEGADVRLPRPLTSFIGRENELTSIAELLESSRLLTLTGPGGAGKSRLSIEAAAQLVERFPGGVFFASLAAIQDPKLVARAIAQDLALEETPGVPAVEGLKEFLREKNALLILDNLEQIPESGETIAELLAALPRLRILATSRSPLRVSGEQEFPVPSLPAPDAGALADLDELRANPTVVLFLERARAAKPGFKLTEANAGDVQGICARLDGLPLAVELAAVRIKLFSPQALLARLDHRLEVLKGGLRDLPGRHQTLRQAIAWGYDLLDEPSQRFFRLQSVFLGGCSMASAAALSEVGGESIDVFDAITALTDQSLLRQEEGRDGEPRLTMLETIREFSREQLVKAGEAEQAEAAHRDHFLEQAQKAEPELTGSDPAPWLDRLEDEHDNFRSVIDRCLRSGDAAPALRLGSALWRFWVTRGHINEGRRRFEEILALPRESVDERVQALALHGCATLAHYRGENARSRALLSECLSLWRKLGDRSGLAAALNNLAWVNCESSQLETARALSTEALSLHEELSDERGQALAHNNLGWVAGYQGAYDEAIASHQRSLELRREIGDQRGEAFALTNIAWNQHYLGRYDKALELTEAASTIALNVGDQVTYGLLLTLRAKVAKDRSQLDEAQAFGEQALAAWRRGGNRSGVGWATMQLAQIAYWRGEYSRAGELEREALEVWGEIGSPWGAGVSLRSLARIAVAETRHDDAIALLRESFARACEFNGRLDFAECAETAAKIRPQAQTAERLATLLAAAAGMRNRIHSPLPPSEEPAMEEQLAELRSSLGADFEEVWREGEQTSIEYLLRDL